jgi:short-subunit dehydrogenase
MTQPRVILILALLFVPLLLAQGAGARVEAESAYSKAQTYSGALRYLRVDLGYEVVEKDPDSAYLVFRYAAPGQPKSESFGTVEVVEADLTKDADVNRVEKVLKENSAITLLVNNAGNSTLAPVAKTTEEDAAAMIALNVTALTRLTHAVLPAFLSRNHGAIVNVASVLSFHALPISAIYSGTKGYVMNFSRGLQQELAETNVRLQLVMPAATATELWDLSGVPLASLNQATVMTSENLVDAALAGFDKGEDITLPSVADASLWDKFDQARSTLFAATQTGEPAPRYRAV